MPVVSVAKRHFFPVEEVNVQTWSILLKLIFPMPTDIPGASYQKLRLLTDVENPWFPDYDVIFGGLSWIFMDFPDLLVTV